MKLLARSINWPRLLWLAHRQTALPQLYSLLQGPGASVVPTSIQEQLLAHYKSNARRNRALLDAEHAAISLLEENGIEALGLRMPSLLEEHYKDPGLREYEPLDLLVRPKHVDRARDLLLRTGYRRVFELSRQREAMQRRARSFLPLHNDEQNIRLHLHDRLLPQFFALKGEEARVWDDRRTVSDGRGLIPSDTSLLILLCAYGTLNLWTRLPWIADVARLTATISAADWPALISRAEAAGAGRMLQLGLALAHDLFGTLLPTPLATAILSDDAVQASVAEVRSRLFDGADDRVGELQRARFRLAMRERRSDRVRYLANFISTPTVEDWNTVKLPDTLVYAYHLVRPVRLAGDILRSLRGRSKNAPYFATPMPLVDRMIEMAGLNSDDVVYDLGCGDGRIVIRAAQLYGTRGLGVDLDPERIAESRANARAAGVENLVRFELKNVLEVDLEPASVIMIWLLPTQHLQLRPKLLKELRPGARIVGHSFDMGDWTPAKTEMVEVPAWGQESQIAYMWTVGEEPAATAGARTLSPVNA
jgi:SAM-dependent methyltransferase